MTSRSLVDKYLSGQSAQYLIDSLVEDLPPLPAIKSSLMRDLPKDTVVRIEDNVFYLQSNNQHHKSAIYEQLRYFESAYPELEFVVD